MSQGTGFLKNDRILGFLWYWGFCFWNSPIKGSFMIKRVTPLRRNLFLKKIFFWEIQNLFYPSKDSTHFYLISKSFMLFWKILKNISDMSRRGGESFRQERGQKIDNEASLRNHKWCFNMNKSIQRGKTNLGFWRGLKILDFFPHG